MKTRMNVSFQFWIRIKSMLLSTLLLIAVVVVSSMQIVVVRRSYHCSNHRYNYYDSPNMNVDSRCWHPPRTFARHINVVASATSRSSNDDELSESSTTAPTTTDETTTTTVSAKNDKYAYLVTVREGVLEFGHNLNDWNEAIAIISNILHSDSSNVDAENALAMALNWKSWAVTKSKIARKYIKPQPPNVQQIRTSLEWLQNGPLQLNSDHRTVLCHGILQYPEAYLLQPQDFYMDAIQMAPEPYRNNPMEFRNLLLSNPSVLKYRYNCIDTGCSSNCGNCWTSF